MGTLIPDHDYFQDFLQPAESHALLESIRDNTPWRDDTITLYGRTYPVPRRTALFGDDGAHYRYSRIAMNPLPWPTDVERVRRRIEEFTSHSFNAVLINLYRDGRDANGWHADNEPELGLQPVIASLSLGAQRTMRFKRRDGTAKWSCDLESGSLQVMRGDAQSDWLHCIPRQLRVTEPRINLTFRYIDTSRATA